MKRLLQHILAYILCAAWIGFMAFMFIVVYLFGDILMAVILLAVFVVTGYLLCNYTDKIGL